jgi:hypothetical protein
MKLGMYIMAPEPISTTYFINPYHQCVRLYVYPPIVARQRLVKNVTTATNENATLEELFVASFSMRSVLYQKKVGDRLFPELLVKYYPKGALLLQSFIDFTLLKS